MQSARQKWGNVESPYWKSQSMIACKNSPMVGWSAVGWSDRSDGWMVGGWIYSRSDGWFVCLLIS